MLDNIKALIAQVEIFNILLKRKRLIKVRDNINKDTSRARSYSIKVPNNETNKIVNKLFYLVWELVYMILDLINMFL